MLTGQRSPAAHQLIRGSHDQLRYWAININWYITCIIKHFPIIDHDDGIWLGARMYYYIKRDWKTDIYNAGKTRLTIEGWTHRNPSRVVLSQAVDWCIFFTRKIQHSGDWERSRPQGPKHIHNFLMTVRPLSWACGHGTEMLLILKKSIFDLIRPRYILIWQSKEMSHDFVRSKSVAKTCSSHWGYRNPSPPLLLADTLFSLGILHLRLFCDSWEIDLLYSSTNNGRFLLSEISRTVIFQTVTKTNITLS